MDKSNSYFFLSGFISLSLFSLILLLFFKMIFSDKKVIIYAINKDKFISVSFDIPKEKEIVKSITKPVVETPEPIKSEQVNVANLFSDVWTKKIKPEKKPKPKKINKRLLEVLNKTEISKKKKFLLKQKEVTKVASTGNEVNEYRAKIQAIVYENFYPPQNSQGNSVVAVIYLGAMGKLDDFRVLKYSDSKLLNEECDKLKNRLMHKLFPKNPDNISGNYKIILTSKE